MRAWFLAVLLVGGVAVVAQMHAQAPAADVVPVVSDEAKRAIADRQAMLRGLALVKAALQKEEDATVADLSRIIQSLQQAQPDYDLTPTLTYAKKKKAGGA